MSTDERFWAKADRSAGTDGCWPWIGAIWSRGYGSVRRAQRSKLAHRVAYELMVGPIPVGLTLDHLCRNRRCVNPGHLDPVSLAVNILRGIGPTADNARKSACIAGHPFDGSNTYRLGSRRQCRACNRGAVGRYRARLRVVA